MNWEFFCQQLEYGKNIDEACFYFSDDPEQKEYFLGYRPEFDEPYWLGSPEGENACEFATAEELITAPLFSGRSLKERWDDVVICHIMGLSVDEWLESVLGEQSKFSFT